MCSFYRTIFPSRKPQIVQITINLRNNNRHGIGYARNETIRYFFLKNHEKLHMDIELAKL